MWAPVAWVLAAAGVPILSGLDASPPGVLRVVMVDVSGAVQHAPGATLSTAETVDTLVNVPLRRHDAQLGLLAFDTAPILPGNVPVPERAQVAEAALPPSDRREPPVYTARQLEAYAAGHVAALDGSPLLQWQWHAELFLPTLRARMAAAPSYWPPRGVIVDGVVEPPDFKDDYIAKAKMEMGKMDTSAIAQVTAALGGDMGLIYAHLLGRALVGSNMYRRLHFARDAQTCTRLPVAGRHGHAGDIDERVTAPADALSKMVRNVAALVLKPPSRAWQVVLVSARPDSLIHTVLFLDALRQHTQSSSVGPGQVFVALTADDDDVVDAVVALRALEAYATDRGLGSLSFLCLFLTLAGDSAYMAGALLNALPRVAWPDAGVNDNVYDDDDDEDAPFRTDSLPTTEDSHHNVRMLVDWIGRAHRRLLGVNDVVSYRVRLSVMPHLASRLTPERLWWHRARSALYACVQLYPKAWQCDGVGYFHLLFERSIVAGYTTKQATRADEIARLVRQVDGVRLSFVRRAADKVLMVYYLVPESLHLKPRLPIIL